MPTPTTYYLNCPSLGSSTAVFTNAGLSTCAPDGYYSDGNIVRQQVSCVLGPQQPCPSCGTQCGQLFGNSSGSGIYRYSLEMGAATGAIIIKFNPFTIPDGILVDLGGTKYNAVSSVIYGYLAAPANLPTYLGRTSDATTCGLSGGTFALDEYDYVGGVFVPTGSTISTSVSAPQNKTTVNSPQNCVMVIPKTTATPSTLLVSIFGPCGDTLSSLSVDCPAALTSFACSIKYTTALQLCTDGPPENQTYYTVPVTGAGGQLGLYDWVFSDVNGANVLPDGFYQAKSVTGSQDYFQVANGVIIAFGLCA